MNQQDKLFETSRQFQQKLSIAVTRYFLDHNLEPEIFKKYRDFLMRRPFTVLQWILHNCPPHVLKKYLAENWVSHSELERSLKEEGIPFQMRALLLVSLGKDITALPVKTPTKDPLYLLTLTQLKLFERLPRLRLALSRLTFSAAEKGTGTDGMTVYYNPAQICSLFQKNSLEAYYFHMILHCLWLHVAVPAGHDAGLWNLACDISAFSLAETLLPSLPFDNKKPGHEICCSFPDALETSSVRALYDYIAALPAATVSEWADIFTVDDHSYWYDNRHGGDLAVWSRLRRELGAMQSPYKTHFGLTPGSRLERLELKKKARFDFGSYLRRFTVTEEELQIDPDSFDYIPYLYGLAHYGNLPLVEPLEYTETSKVEELVIAIDTSGSCSADVVQQFLAETCRILTDKQNFFRKMNVHILQCDSMIQDHTLIRSVEEWEEYIRHIRISGRGGTDFNPVFRYTNRMIKEKKFRRLKGLLYFTDGDGIYPTDSPSYETAFIFTDRRFLNQPVPDWAVKLCLNMT